MSEMKKLSMEEAKKMADECIVPQDLKEAHYLYNEKLWPYRYVKPNYGIDAEAWNKGFKLLGKTVMLDQKEYSIALIVLCLKDAPFKIDAATLRSLDPTIVEQIGLEIKGGPGAPALNIGPLSRSRSKNGSSIEREGKTNRSTRGSKRRS